MNDILINGAAARPAVAWRSNIALLYAARGVRGFGDGFAIIILPAYLTAIGYDPVADRHRRDGCAARHGAVDARASA